MNNMNSMSAEKVNVKEYIKSKLKAFAETFATLGDIIGGTTDVAKLTEAEIEAEKIIEASNIKAITALEKRVEIPESEAKGGKANGTKRKKKYEIKTQVQGQQTIAGIDEDKTNAKKAKQKDDDYVK